ncbi:GTPase IMAP family member 4-like [Sardina pilchardus]|uniref:GTPase IMAP family member 4-like n=1 Tax=Sardina pilchardus TaxID=27697 RepID=UPI002E0F5127
MFRKTPSFGSDLTQSELRIVLLGSKESGISSAGNTILGSDEFDLKKHAECVKKERVVAGRQICVIDTPGRREYSASLTPTLCLQEAVRSVTLCPPGPHAFLLVVNIMIPFDVASKEAVMEHLNLFDEAVWKHIIVLFTHGDQLGDMDIQQYIEREGEPLQWVLEKCGNRFHVFNNEIKDDSTQVELLKKIDVMVAGNHGSHFELDMERLCTITKEKGEYEQSNERNKEQQHSEILRLKMGNEHKLAEQRIVLTGQESAGKTSTAETILNIWDSDHLKTTLLSTTSEATVGRWQVTVVDTPGWLRDAPQSQTSKRIKQEIVRSVSLCPPGPHAVLLVIPANVKFTEAEETAINEHLELLGERVWNHTIVLFTHPEWMGDSPIELYIESEGEPLDRIIKKCGCRYHVLSNDSPGQSQVEALLEKIEVMVAGNSNCFYGMDEKSQKDMSDDGCEEEIEDASCSTVKLPRGDPEDVSGQIKRSTDISSGYGTALSECETTNSAEHDRPNL